MVRVLFGEIIHSWLGRPSCYNLIITECNRSIKKDKRFTGRGSHRGPGCVRHHTVSIHKSKEGLQILLPPGTFLSQNRVQGVISP